MHENFADNRGSLFSESRRALLCRQCVVGKHVAYLGTGAYGENWIAHVAPGRRPSGDCDARGDAGHLVDIVAVARGQILPRRGLVVDYEAERSRRVLDDTIHRGRHRHEDGVDESCERDGEDSQNRAAQIPAHVAFDQFDPVEHDAPVQTERSDSSRLMREARHAGSNPPSAPIKSAAIIPDTNAPSVSRNLKMNSPTFISWLLSPVEYATSTPRISPSTPPASASTMLSRTKLVSTLKRLKPSTRSTPISLVRRATAEYIVFIAPNTDPTARISATIRPSARN